MKIRHVLETKTRQGVVTIDETATMREAVELLVRNNIGAVVAVSGTQPAGILTERDVLRQVATGGASFLDKSVAEVMTRDIVIGTFDLEVDQAMYTMTEKRFRHLPIMDEGGLAAIISMGDIVRAQVTVAETEAHYLRDYIAGGYR
ncbi:MAG: CBS domain-containing protein [Deltaproteobacteria bacterium]|nr:CBS domain-containing protein [Deltaproteobacteria bacterium]